VYVIHPPEVKRSDEVTGWAARELERMAGLSRRELGLAALVVAALGCWIFGRQVIDATTVAVAVICLIVVGGIVTWNDVLANKQVPSGASSAMACDGAQQRPATT
jgi:L-tartrate/succinate antiporter